MGRKFVQTSIFLLCLLTTVLKAQDWKRQYEQAVIAYQSQQYPAALSGAERAYSNAPDKTTKTYSLQLVTAILLETTQYETLLRRIDEEASLFLEIEGPLSKNYAEALKKHVTALEMSNMFPAALEKIELLVSVTEKIYGYEHLESIKARLSQGTLMFQSGAYTDARNTLQACIKKLGDHPNGLEYYLTTLYLAGLTDIKLKSESEARLKFQEYLHLAKTHHLEGTEEYQQVAAQLPEGVVYGLDVKSNDQRNALGRHLKQGILLHEQLKLDSALMKYSFCEEMIVQEKLENKTAFSLYLNYASAAVSKGYVTIAENKLAIATALANRLFTGQGPELGHLYKVTGDVLLLNGRNQEATDKYLQALTLLNGLPLQTRASNVKNIAAKLLNAYALASARKVINSIDPETLKNLSSQDQADIGMLYVAALEGQDSIAIAYLTTQLKSTHDPVSKARLQVKLATFYIQTGDKTGATKLLQDVKNQKDAGAKAKADATFQLARVYQDAGQFNEAERSYGAAINVYREAGDVFIKELEEASNSLATLYLSLGNYDAAEQLYVNLIKHTNPPSAFYSTLNQNLAVVYEQTSRYEEAKNLLEQTLSLDKQFIGTRPSDYAVTLQNLGSLYLKTGDLKKAKELFIQALEIDKQNSGVESLPYASKLANLGTVYQESGDLNTAKDCYEKALAIRRIHIGEKHPDYVYNQYLLAVLFQRQRQLDAAYPLFKSISEFYIDEINEVFSALSEIEKTAFHNKVSEVILAYEDFAIEYGEVRQSVLGELYDFRLATKAIILNSLTTMRTHIVRSGNPALLSKFSEWQHLKIEIAKRYVAGYAEKPEMEAHIEALQSKANTLEKYLSAQSALFADHYNGKKITWRQVQAALKPGEAAIEMIRLQLNQKNDSIVYAALILQPGSPTPRIVVYNNGRFLEGREFTMYKNCILHQVENTRSYATYWKPLASLLPNVHRVYFSPDGVFNKINLQTLFDTETQKFLIDGIDVRLVSNSRELLLNRNTHRKQHTSATLLGYPDFGSAVETQKSAPSMQHLMALSRTGRMDEIPDLPGTQQEVNQIKSLLEKNGWQVQLFTRSEATEEKIKQAHNPTVLHIATHGFFIESPERETKLIYSQQINDYERTPLLRSGLLLAGSEKYLTGKQENKSTPSDDGILTALEATNLSLDDTDLVVLSACETASGQIKNGEGVFGLQRAFLVSGAKSVMMSLWRVDDQATQELMTTFYNLWLTSHDKYEALRKTQFKIREQFPQPYYWGSFILIGH